MVKTRLDCVPNMSHGRSEWFQCTNTAWLAVEVSVIMHTTAQHIRLLLLHLVKAFLSVSTHHAAVKEGDTLLHLNLQLVLILVRLYNLQA